MSTQRKDSNGQISRTFYIGSSVNVSFNATSAQSAALSSTETQARIVATQPCYIAVGTNPTATTASTYLPAGISEYIAVNPGDKIAALQVTAAGVLNITEAQ